MTSPLIQPLRIQFDVKVPMRDGVLLSADVYRPASGDRFPVLLLRTIYDNQMPRYVDWARRFVQAGFAVVMQDCRGRFDSDGAWAPYVNEARDGFDTHEWIGRQPWCNGKIGTFGISYPGFTQTLPAVQASKYLKALAPIASQQDNFGHIYVEGVLHLHVAMFFINVVGRSMQREARALLNDNELYRRLPLISALDDIADIPFYRNVISHCTFDEFWKSYSLRDRYREIGVPALFITGWYDSLLHETLKLFNGFRKQGGTAEARNQTRLIIGPWPHQALGSASPPGNVEFGPPAEMDLVAEQIRWYDWQLKGVSNGMEAEGPIHLFVMGDNAWRHENEWPLARTEFTEFFFHSRGSANTGGGDGSLSRSSPTEEPPDRFIYDPADPVPSWGAQYQNLDRTGPRDRRDIERRQDVLVYTSAPLDRDLEVTGPVTATIYAASSAPDTDFTATLVDVHPDGRAINLCEGIRRARFRESVEKPALIEPMKTYEYRIDMWDTSNVFNAGHRIRVEISSSNFPRFDRNLNTGHQPGMDAEMAIARQAIFHNGLHPSRVTLPTIPR
ncbi:MAG: CocE/NonD family hydrolase [Chloroflexi bacterium]|nr:CocE/NonD family hydrolase [Chloroflexota bacterium]